MLDSVDLLNAREIFSFPHLEVVLSILMKGTLAMRFTSEANPGDLTHVTTSGSDRGVISNSSVKLPQNVLADLRTDHAGEVGAIQIYQGVLFFARDPALRAFAAKHLVTERRHLRNIELWLPSSHYSRLLPVWRLAGFLTGAVPALIGPKAVYATIEAVETFVYRHYNEQIQTLASIPSLKSLRLTLLSCQIDEETHREEAVIAFGSVKRDILLRAWCAIVAAGSAAAVTVSRIV